MAQVPAAAVAKQHRLHISGLHASTKVADLAARFSSFGTVLPSVPAVEGLGVDANGYPRTYAFLTLETTDALLAKCTSMLSGSMWKGHKLRISPAQLTYHQRMDAERAALEAAGPVKLKTKKRKANPDPLVGTATNKFELVTATNFKRHAGWILDPTPVPTPLMPLICRPSHPLPAVPAKVVTSWTREAPKSKASKAARALARSGVPAAVVSNTLTRARRLRIDPRRWGRKRSLFDETMSAGWEGRGSWECDDEMGGGEEIKWVWRDREGNVRHEEVVRRIGGGGATTYTDNFSNLLDRMDRPSTSTLPIPAVAPESSTTGRARSLSPPVYVSAAARTLLYNSEDAFHLRLATQSGQEQLDEGQAERDALNRILEGLLGDDFEEGDKGTVAQGKRPLVEGFGSGDESDGDEAVMRLRGGAADDDSDSDSDDSATEVQTSEDAVMAAVPPPKTQLEMGTLRDMFKPQETTTSFSLLNDFELDLEPLPRTPSPEPFYTYPTPTAASIPAAAGFHASNAFIPPAPLGRSARTWVGTNGSGPFFAFPSGIFEDKDGGVINQAVSALGVDEERVGVAVRVSNVAAEVGSPFYKFGTAEEIEEEHQKLRESLRGQARKRHREASKRVRKKGNGKRRVGREE